MNDLTTIFELNAALPLLVAAGLGLVIGLERSLAGKNAGMRTYALVALGTALFIVVSRLITDMFLGQTAFDPLRVAAAVVMGIGFIGTGIAAIGTARHGGLTTAAGIWVTAAVGMASGFELYGLAITATVLTLLIFTVFWRLERYLERVGGYSPLDGEDHRS
jgi:putative Mg2+ transporter-C (MgtC) family protein